MMKSILLLSALALSSTAGCAESPDDPITNVGGGGKADDATSPTESGALTPLSQDEMFQVYALEVECLHSTRIANDTYLQGIKLICVPRGSDFVPTQLYLAVVPLGEADGALKMFKFPELVSELQGTPTFHTTDASASVSWTATINDKTTTGSMTVDLTGPSEAPAVAARYTFAQP